MLRYLHVSRKTDDLPATPDLLCELDPLGDLDRLDLSQRVSSPPVDSLSTV